MNRVVKVLQIGSKIAIEEDAFAFIVGSNITECSADMSDFRYSIKRCGLSESYMDVCNRIAVDKEAWCDDTVPYTAIEKIIHDEAGVYIGETTKLNQYYNEENSVVMTVIDTYRKHRIHEREIYVIDTKRFCRIDNFDKLKGLDWKLIM